MDRTWLRRKRRGGGHAFAVNHEMITQFKTYR